MQRIPANASLTNVKNLLFTNNHNIAKLLFVDHDGNPVVLEQPQINCFHPVNHTFSICSENKTLDVYWRSIHEIHLCS